MAIPNPSQLGLIRATETEWCVTIDGRQILKFGGADARDRAQRYLDDLCRAGMAQPTHAEDGAEPAE